MEFSVRLCSFPITLDVASNYNKIVKIVERHRDVDLLVFPEAALSGYVTDEKILSEIDFDELEGYVEEIKNLTIRTRTSIWFGTILQKQKGYTMSAIGFSYKGDSYRYDKINLATKERGVFTPGSVLKSFSMPINAESDSSVEFGVFLCRELKYPEMWRLMAKRGVECFIHLNNAVADAGRPSDEFSVWKSQLVARASENQRFVFSVNASAQYLKSPTIVIAPNGQVLTELVGDEGISNKIQVNTKESSSWYVDQMRDDLIELKWIG